MQSSNPNRSEDSSSPSQPAGAETQRAGHSGEGAASALAHLQKQARQQRRESGGPDDTSTS